MIILSIYNQTDLIDGPHSVGVHLIPCTDSNLLYCTNITKVQTLKAEHGHTRICSIYKDNFQ